MFFWLLILSSGSFLFNIYYNIHRNQVKRNQVKRNQVYNKIIPKNQNRRDLRKKTTPKNTQYDICIIGGGVSGLGVAALIAKYDHHMKNKRIIILEQNESIGGGLHTFSRPQFKQYHDVGLHYTGKELIDQLKLICTGDIPKFTKNNGIYDKIKLYNNSQDITWNIPAGKKPFHTSLLNFLKKDEARKYIDDIEFVTSNPQIKLFFTFKILHESYHLPLFLYQFLQNTFCKRTIELMKINVQDYFQNNIISNDDQHHTKLRLLTGTRGNYGSIKHNNAFTHLSITSHFIEGSYFPTNGPDDITHALIHTIKNGFKQADIICQHSVTNVEREISNVYHIRCKNKTVFTCNKIISSIGYQGTYQLFPNSFPNNLKPTPSNLNMQFAFVELNTLNTTSYPSSPLPRYNTWLDVNNTIDCTQVFISCSTAKKEKIITDDNTINATIITTRNIKLTPKEITYIISIVFGNKTNITNISIAGPNEIKKFLGRNTAYGLTNNWDKISMPIVLENGTLFMTGQDILSPGIAGALASSIITAHCFLPIDSIIDMSLHM